MIDYEDFLKPDIRVGAIIEAEPFPQARKPAYRLKIDFGAEIGIKRSSAQITELYALKDLIGRQVLAVINLPERQIGPFMSQVLTLGAAQADGSVVLLAPDRPVPNGAKMF